MSKAATPKPQPAARRMKPQHYKPGIDAGRIRDLREAVESDRELTRAERVDISQALLALNDFIMLQELQFARIHPADEFATHLAVRVVAALITEYGIRQKTAIRAALPNGDEKAVNRVQRAYSKWKKEKGGQVSVWPVDTTTPVEAAAIREKLGYIDEQQLFSLFHIKPGTRTQSPISRKPKRGPP